MLQVLSTLARKFGAPFRKKSVEQEFCERNRRFWNEWRRDLPPADPNAVVVTPLTSNPYVVLSAAVPPTLIAGTIGAKSLFLQKKSPKANLWYRDIVESFGPGEIRSIRDFTGEAKKVETDVQDLLSGIKTPNDLLKLTYHNVHVGDFAYDSAMRVKPWQASVWKVDERVLQGLQGVVTAVRAAERICEIYDVRAASIDRGHSTYLGGLMRTFASKGVDIYLGTIRLLKYRHGNNFQFRNVIRPSHALVDTVLARRKTEVLAVADDYAVRYFAERPQEAGLKQYESAAEFCAEYKLDPSKPCAFVMLHAFNDYPHCAGTIAYADYYHWLVDTLETAKQVKDVNWVFKQHPAIRFYPSDVDSGELVKAVNMDHIVYLDETRHIKRSSLARIAHIIVTCIGSSGLEYSCRGVPAVVAGQTHYSGFGIAHEADTPEQYRANLQRVGSMTKLSPETVEMARLILYLANADYDTGPASLLPPLGHGQRLESDRDELLKYIMGQFGSPEVEKAMRAFCEFVEAEDAIQYLNPNYYPLLDGLGPIRSRPANAEG